MSLAWAKAHAKGVICSQTQVRTTDMSRWLSAGYPGVIITTRETDLLAAYAASWLSGTTTTTNNNDK